MSDLICPFSAPLLQEDHCCEYAQQVIRRGGSEIACQQAKQYLRCSKVHAHIKTSALEAMDIEDDLLSVPHAQLVKIQYGGLLGLSLLLEQEGIDNRAIKNVWQLINAAVDQFTSAEQIPCQLTTESIQEYKLPRRRRKP